MAAVWAWGIRNMRTLVISVCWSGRRCGRAGLTVLLFFNDPATGVMRHADAGYEQAEETARKNHLKLPLLRNA